LDAGQFRLDFPEFTNTTTFPDSSVNFWLGVAVKMLRESRWADLLDVGLELFMAHNLSLEKAAASGGVPGIQYGAVSGKTVDKLSITYDATIGIVPDAGHWNLSTYGTRFLWMMNMAGMGPTQVGAGAAGFDPGQVYIYGGTYGPGWPYGY
jgi:hypothetical protein